MISVIIPVYNGAAFVENCIRSILNQSYQDLEIIVIDDGSTDNSYQICESLAKEDGRILLIHQENSGVSAARNKGIALARGEYIMFVDSDDQLLDGAIMPTVLAEKWDCLLFDMQNCEDGKERQIKKLNLIKNLPLEKTEILKAACENKLNSSCAKIYRRELVTRNNLTFDESMVVAEDAKFVLDVIEKSKQIGYIPKPIYRYNHSNDSGNRRLLRCPEQIVCNSIQLYYHRKSVIERCAVKAEKAYELQRIIADRLVRDIFEAIGSLLIFNIQCEQTKQIAIPEINNIYSVYRKSFSVGTKIKSVLLIRDVKWAIKIYAKLREIYIRV